MSDLNPVDAAIHALVEALRAVPEFVDVDVHKGWPANVDFALPAMAVTAQRPNLTKEDGRIYRVDDVEGDPTQEDVFFLRASYELPLTLDFWTKTKTQRMDLEPALRSLFFPTVADNGVEEPPPPGLMLTIPHHDVKIRVDVIDENREDEGSARDGYFRVSYALQTEIPVLTKVRYTRADFTHAADVGVDVEV